MKQKEIDKKFDEIVDFAGIEQFIDSPVKVYSTRHVRAARASRSPCTCSPRSSSSTRSSPSATSSSSASASTTSTAFASRVSTIVVVTHGMGTVETMCDRAAWLDHGVLQVTGTGAEVTAAYTDQVNAREHAERERVATEAGDGLVATAAVRSIEDLQIEGVDFVGADGEPADVGIYRERFTIRIHYVATKPVTNPVFGVAIHTAALVHVTGTNTKIDDTPLGTLSGRGHVDFSVESLPLTPGDYEITVAVSDEFIQHNYDRHEREYHLRVRSGTDRQTPEGVIDMLGQWSTDSDERPATSTWTVGR